MIIKGPVKNFKTPTQRILITDDTEIPHNTNVVLQPAILDRGKHLIILHPTKFLKYFIPKSTFDKWFVYICVLNWWPFCLRRHRKHCQLYDTVNPLCVRISGSLLFRSSSVFFLFFCQSFFFLPLIDEKLFSLMFPAGEPSNGRLPCWWESLSCKPRESRVFSDSPAL